nr:MAG TPA: 43 kDa tail protein [Caudoviricetes sp.]
MSQYTYQLTLHPPNGGQGRDLTQLVQAIHWSGSIQQIARELQVAIVVPRDGSITPPQLVEGATLTFRHRGVTRFVGRLLKSTVTTKNSVADVSALDGGRYLAGNRGWYKFRDTSPEGAVAALCQDFGIPVGNLAGTGALVSRKFPGVELDRIISTLYGLAGEQTGKRYIARFSGDGKLEVIEKPSSASLEVVQTMGVTNTWDITKLCNSVAIYTDDGQLVRRVGDDGSQALNGRLEHIVIQRRGEDASQEAQAWLDDHGLQQSLTVEVLDPPLELVSGQAVVLRDTGSGARGLFWVDSDTHTWKNKQHFGKFRLNFRSIMASTSAGSELR